MARTLPFVAILAAVVALSAPAAASATIYRGSDAGFELAVNTRADRASLRIPAAQQSATYFVVMCARSQDRKGKVLIGYLPASVPTTRFGSDVQNFSRRARSCWVHVNDDYVTKVAQIKLRPRARR